MTITQKILVALCAILLVGGIGFIIYHQFKISERQMIIEQQMVATKQLADNISRAQASFGTKENLEAIAKQNNVDLKVIQDDLDKLHAEITAINQVVISSRGQVANNIPPTSTGPNTNPNPPILASKCFDKDAKEMPCPNPDPFGYMRTRQVLQLNEKFDSTQVPIGSVGFSAWQDKPFDINILPREYKITTVLGTDENNRQYAYNKFVVRTNDKEYPVKITQNDFVQEYPSPKFSFNPHLYGGIGAGVNITNSPIKGEFTPSLTLGLFSYGQTKTSPAISIGQVGLGYGVVSQRPQVVINPVNFNVGKVISGNLVNNTYIGPTAQIGTDGNFMIGVGITTGF